MSDTTSHAEKFAGDPAYHLAGVEQAAGEAAFAWEQGDSEYAYECISCLRRDLRAAIVYMRRQEADSDE
jgi:hypothetical protein